MKMPVKTRMWVRSPRSQPLSRYTHNGFDYTIPVAGSRVEKTEDGYRLVPTAAAVKVDMSKR